MPPWMAIYALFSLFISQQWLRHFRTQPENSIIIGIVILISSYIMYTQYTEYQNRSKDTTVVSVLGENTHILIKHNLRLADQLVILKKHYEWIDPDAYHQVMTHLHDFLEKYSMLLMRSQNKVKISDAHSLLQSRREFMNNLYAFYLKDATTVKDPRFKKILLTSHAATYRYIEILRNKHPNLIAILPPMPQSVEPMSTKPTSFEII